MNDELPSAEDTLAQAMTSAANYLQHTMATRAATARIAAHLMGKLQTQGSRIATPYRPHAHTPACPRCHRHDGWFQWTDTNELTCICDPAAWPAAPRQAPPVPVVPRSQPRGAGSQQLIQRMADQERISRTLIARTQRHLASTTRCLAQSYHCIYTSQDRVWRPR